MAKRSKASNCWVGKTPDAPGATPTGWRFLVTTANKEDIESSIELARRLSYEPPHYAATAATQGRILARFAKGIDDSDPFDAAITALVGMLSYPASPGR